MQKFPGINEPSGIPILLDWRFMGCLAEFCNKTPEELAQGCKSYEDIINRCRGFITDPQVARGFIAYVENRLPVSMTPEIKRALHLPINQG